MNPINKFMLFPCLTIVMLFSTIVSATTPSNDNAGFLSGYTKLKISDENPLTQYYIAPNAMKKFAGYDAILVEQPQIFIAANSPYRGFKPAKMNAISEALRASVVEKLSNHYTIATQPGNNVLYLRLALVDFSISKERTHILGYTPLGLVFRGLKDVTHTSFENAVQHISLLGVKIEGEVSDSQSAEVLGQFIDSRPSSPDPETWKQLLEEMLQFGSTIDCQLQNASKPQDAYKSCQK